MASGSISSGSSGAAYSGGSSKSNKGLTGGTGRSGRYQPGGYYGGRIHTDQYGNVTYPDAAQNTVASSGGAGEAEDPFEKFGSGFKSLEALNAIINAGKAEPNASALENASENASFNRTAEAPKDRYKQFLLDQFIDPDAIGNTGAWIDRSTGKMVVPTIKQYEKALRQKDRDNADQGDLQQAIRSAQRSSQGVLAADLSNRLRAGNAQRGQDFEGRVNYYLDQLTKRFPGAQYPSNGFYGG